MPVTPQYTYNKNTSIQILVMVKDTSSVVIPQNTGDRFTVQIKPPYANIIVPPYSVGVTGSIISYGNQSGCANFYFNILANATGDWKYKVQYNAFASGSYPLIGPFIQIAGVGAFRVVDDDF